MLLVNTRVCRNFSSATATCSEYTSDCRCRHKTLQYLATTQCFHVASISPSKQKIQQPLANYCACNSEQKSSTLMSQIVFLSIQTCLQIFISSFTDYKLALNCFRKKICVQIEAKGSGNNKRKTRRWSCLICGEREKVFPLSHKNLCTTMYSYPV